MYELTEGQAQEVGGGIDGIPYPYGSQRLILPPWPQDCPFPHALPFPQPPEPIPSIGA